MFQIRARRHADDAPRRALPYRAAGAAGSAALVLLALPPFGLWPVALIALVPLLCLVMQSSALAALGNGALFGLVVGAGVYVGAAVLDATTWLLATLLVMAGCAVFAAVVSRLDTTDPWRFAALAGALWATVEQAFDAAGLPFSLALTLSEQPATLQAAALGGQWLVTFALVALQGALACAWLDRRRWADAVGALIVAVLCTLAGAAHAPVQTGELTVTAVQTRLHPFDYIHAEADGQLQRLQHERLELGATAARSQAQLIAWPELPFARFEARAPQPGWPVTGSAQLIAGNDLAPDGGQFNAVFGVRADGRAVSRHVKSRLLPRLEDKYTKQRSLAPHAALPGRPGSLICYESTFTDVARQLTLAGAGVLVIATSDAFAGPSALPWLHAAYAPLRAIENRRSVVRAANAGPSLVLDPFGRIQQRLDLFERGVITADVALVQGTTLYARHAAAVRTLAAIGALIAIVLALRGRDAPAAGPGGAATSMVLALATLLAYVAGTSVSASRSFAREVPAAHGWPGYGFTAHRRFAASYETLRAGTEADDLDAALAALLRRFGRVQSRAEVNTDRHALARTSVFRVDAAALLDHYGFLHAPMSQQARSDVPCIVTLNDRRTVLVTRRAPAAMEVFLPGQASLVTVPRGWLEQRAVDSARCVLGRAYPWDLAVD